MNKNAKNGPGRPRFQPEIPKGKFTFTDFEIANGVNPKTGKGKECTTLTLRKWLKRELSKRGHSAIVHLKDTFADPTSKNGLGRKQYVYQKRTGVSAKSVAHDTAPVVAAKTPKKASAKSKKAQVTETPTVEVNAVSPETETYEAQKAELLAPVVSIAPAPMVDTPPALVDKTESDNSSATESVAETSETPEAQSPTETETPQPIPEAAPALVG